MIETIRKWFKSTFGNEVSLPEMQESGIKILKDLNDEYRYFAWVSNNFKDRDGEIILDFAHKEFLQFLDSSPDQAPAFWCWHTLGTARKYKVDWWDYTNSFFVYSGILTEEEAKQFKSTENIGMSHGFYAIKIGKYIVKYRTFEISDLPRDVAANPFTAFDLNKILEEKMFTTRKREYLIEKFGEETVAELEAQTKTMEEILEGAGVERKELDEQYEEFIVNYTEERTKETVDSLYEQIVKSLNIEELHTVLQELAKGIKQNSETLPKLVNRIERLEKENSVLKESYDKRISNIFENAPQFQWSSVASGADETTEVKEEDLTEQEKKEIKEGEGWMKNLSPLKEGS